VTERRKYRPGRRLTMRALVARLLRDEYVMLFGVPKHPGWIGSMQFNVLRGFCRSGAFREAKPNR